MVEVDCEKTGVTFEASSTRVRNHPVIMSIVSNSSKEGWYSAALSVLKENKGKFDSVEAYIALLNNTRDRHFGRGKYDYRVYRNAHLPQIEEAITSYMDTYDWNMPVEDDMQTLASFPIGLLGRRLATYVVGPLVRTTDASAEMQNRLKSEAIEAVTKPLRDAKDAQEKEAKRQLLVSFKDREVVKEQAFQARGGTPYAGDYKFFLEEKRVLRCVHSWYAKADDDYLQNEDAVVCKFAIPTSEELESAEYLQCVTWMQDALKEQEKHV